MPIDRWTVTFLPSVCVKDGIVLVIVRDFCSIVVGYDSAVVVGGGDGGVSVVVEESVIFVSAIVLDVGINSCCRVFGRFCFCEGKIMELRWPVPLYTFFSLFIKN